MFITITQCFLDSEISSSDKVIIATTVDALSEQNIVSYNEVVDICLANGQAKKKMLDDKLDTLSSGKHIFALVHTKKSHAF